MAFFPRAFYNNHITQDKSFTPLFRLLDDFDTYSRQCSPKSTRHTALPQWQPKFDVRETADAYELHGELPGVSKDNVHIDFTEPQTMQVQGKVERTYTAGSHPNAQVEDHAMSGALPEADAADEESKTSHQATVEDGQEDEDWDNASTSAPATPATTTAEVAKPEEAKKPVDKAKYWLTERSIGQFTRSFNFPSRVDQDAVSANFKDGILSIVVPKAKKHESRRIAIN